MQILDIRPAPPGAGRTVALFDFELNEHIRFFGLRLVQTEDGRHLTYAPNSHGVRVATFSRELADTISRAASAAYREGFARDSNIQSA
jgi:hypothetical protein